MSANIAIVCAEPRVRWRSRGFNLDLLPAKLQHHRMEKQSQKQSGPAAALNDLWRWSTTPPQSYLVYVVCLFLILGLSYYAGTLNPKKRIHVEPQATTQPSG